MSDRGNPLVEGILATSEVKNGNGRYYSKDLWEREIGKYMQSVKENRAISFVFFSVRQTLPLWSLIIYMKNQEAVNSIPALCN